jgi:ferredoxin
MITNTHNESQGFQAANLYANICPFEGDSQTGVASMCKAKVTFADIGKTVTVPEGTRLIDIAEGVGSGIMYGCRQCSCGRCMTEVVDGEDRLEPPSVLEIKVLEHHEGGANSRLACQVKVRGDVTLRPRPQA